MGHVDCAENLGLQLQVICIIGSLVDFVFLCDIHKLYSKTQIYLI